MHATPQFESFEGRLLLSAVLAAGQTEVVELANGSQAVLKNTGDSAIEYDPTGPDGLEVNLLADGGQFQTNTWARIGDTDPADDFLLGRSVLGKGLCYAGTYYAPIVGPSAFQAGSVDELIVRSGDLASGWVTEGDVDALKLCGGDLYDLFAVGSVWHLQVGGAVRGSVAIDGDVDCLCAGEITAPATVSITGRLEHLTAGRLTGGADDYGYAGLYVDGGVGTICAGELTGGVNSTLDIGVTGGIGALHAGQISGGEAVDGGYASLNLSVTGDVGSLAAWSVVGGTGTGLAEMYVFVGSQWGDDGSLLAAGDIGHFYAGELMGGNVTGDGEAAFRMFVENDLAQTRIGRVVGSGIRRAAADPAVEIFVGHDIGTFCANVISGGRAVGPEALSYVQIQAGHDIHMLRAWQITGGRTADDGFAFVDISAEHDIHRFESYSIRGSGRRWGACDPAVQIRAGNDLHAFRATRIVAGQEGVVNVLAGMDAWGNVSGEYDDMGHFVPGSIGWMCVGAIVGAGGEVHIAAGGDIEFLKACRMVSGGGIVRVVAGWDLTACVFRIRSQQVTDPDSGETVEGVTFAAGGMLTDLWGTIGDDFSEDGLLDEPPADGEVVEFLPDPLVLPLL